jgi:hypothetical protein
MLQGAGSGTQLRLPGQIHHFAPLLTTAQVPLFFRSADRSSGSVVTR